MFNTFQFRLDCNTLESGYLCTSDSWTLAVAGLSLYKQQMVKLINPFTAMMSLENDQ